MVRLIAHRGFAGVHAENTLGAVCRAARVADAVEIDVRRCATGELVVVHDETVDRISDGAGAVADHALAELRALDVLGTGEGVPTLSAVLGAVPSDTPVNVELKEPGTAADALALATDADPPVFVSSFRPEALATVRDVAPDVERAYLFPTEGESAESALETARDLECAYLHPHHERCTAELVERAHAAGMDVNAWTVREADAARLLVARGVDGLIVDDPAVVPERVVRE